MQILRWIPHPLRRPGGATSLALMHRFSFDLGPLLASRAFATSLQALARPLMAAPNQPLGSFSRFSHGPLNMATVSQVKSDESCKVYKTPSISSANVNIIIPQGSEHPAITQSKKNTETGNAKGTNFFEEDNAKRTNLFEVDDLKESKNIERSSTISKFIVKDERSDKDACRTTTGVADGKKDANDENFNLADQINENIVSEHEEISDSDDEVVYHRKNVLARSEHRDGDLWWKKEFRIADRNETRVEAMMLSDPTDRKCHDGTCVRHCGMKMLQIFSLKLAEISVDGGFAELYGYIAVRDGVDRLLNYVVNFSRDNPISVEQGTLISNIGPKRGIEITAPILIEYDMRIKRDREENDLQLIDGAWIIDNFGSCNKPFRLRIPGYCGAIDLTLARVLHAVEATVEVLISEVRSSFNLSLDCFTSGLDEKSLLFDGSISGSHSLKRSVIAVNSDSSVDLKFEIGAMSSDSYQYHCRMKAKRHGHDIQNIVTYFALISMKVTWSTLPI